MKMIVLKGVLLLAMFVGNIQTRGNLVDEDGFIMSNEASGWLKFFPKHRTMEEAWIMCNQIKGAVLASPLNVPVRDAIKRLLNEHALQILTGIKADLSTGDFFSVEHVPLSSMPVIMESGASNEYESSESCVVWNLNDDTARYVTCDVKHPFVCYKKRDSVQVVGCGTADKAYRADLRTNSCYKHHTVKTTWNKAYKKCTDEGAKLVVINSETEAMVLKELLIKHNNTRDAFINVRNWNEDGVTWESEGKSLEETGFSRWHEGEPNHWHDNTEHCVTITNDGDLYDDPCEDSYTFLCEKNQEKLIV